MQTAPRRSVFGELTDFLATNPTPQDILAYKLSDTIFQLRKAKTKRRLQAGAE